MDSNSKFVTVLGILQQEIGDNAKAHGFHEGVINIPEKLALIHSEVSEALEACREAKPEESLGYVDYDVGGKPVGFMSELADVVIRCFDTAYLVEGDLGKTILEKMAYNRTRPIKHGKNF